MYVHAGETSLIVYTEKHTRQKKQMLTICTIFLLPGIVSQYTNKIRKKTTIRTQQNNTHWTFKLLVALQLILEKIIYINVLNYKTLLILQIFTEYKLYIYYIHI